jgi:hypothetical protein
MSYGFENNNRYQTVYPYTSDKIYVEPDISRGAYRCYKELKEKNIITYIFIVHDIDAGILYYLNIPKYKSAVHSTQNNPLTDRLPDNQHVIYRDNERNPAKSMPIQVPAALNPTQFVKARPDNCNIIITQENKIIPEAKSSSPGSREPSLPGAPGIEPRFPSHDYDKVKQNEIITRLNHVEYQLDVIKNKLNQVPKKEDNCHIM